MKTEAYSPGLEGVIAGITKISDVDPERNSLMYRGYDIRDLAEHSSYEEVAYLLLYGQLPQKSELDEFKRQLVAERNLPASVVDALRCFPQGANAMDALRAGVALMALQDKETMDQSHEANIRKATRLVAKFPALIAYSYRLTHGQEPIAPDEKLTHAENFLYMLTGNKPDTFYAHVFDVSLIAYAEHGFNASTFCGRVTTSTLSDIYSGVVSAIGTLKGPLHGGANEEAMKMLLEIKTPENADHWIKDALATKKKIMGFGHREYKTGDPRAPLLKELGRELGERLGQTQWHEIASTVEDVMVRDKGIYPNVDFPTAYIYYLMNLPIEIYTPIFALSRVAGWSAHFIEQLENNRLIRPKAIYEGPKHRDYVPMERR